jgi:hypothetical protein
MCTGGWMDERGIARTVGRFDFYIGFGHLLRANGGAGGDCKPGSRRLDEVSSCDVVAVHGVLLRCR